MATGQLVGSEVERRFSELEHRELARGLGRVAELADETPGLYTPELVRRLGSLLAWLESSLEPHAAWEEGWLYPALDEIVGSCWATRVMRFEHRQIREAIGRLRDDVRVLRGVRTPDTNHLLQRHLYGLDALVRSHMQREDELLIPLLGTGPAER